MIRTLLFMFLTYLAFAAGSAHGTNRVALIIGNSDYQHAGRLNNPKNGAVLAEKALKSVGFETILLTDRSFDVVKDDLSDSRNMS